MSNLYQNLRKQTPEEQTAYLLSLGMTEEQAADFLGDYRQNQKRVSPTAQGPAFTKSNKWADIQARMEKLRIEKSELQRMSEMVPPKDA